MTFNFNTFNHIDFVDLITGRFYDFDDMDYITRPELFLSVERGTEDNNSCEYWIFDPSKIENTETGEEFITENKEWTFLYSDYDDAVEAQYTRSNWIKKRCDLWLVEDSGDKAAIKQAKEALVSAEKKVEAISMSKRVDTDDNIDSDYEDDDVIDSEEKALESVYENAENFWKIPEKYRTKDVCLATAKELGSVCGDIPEELQSEQFFIEAVTVNKNGKALKYVPDEYLTLKVCLVAIKQHPEMREELFEYIPEELHEKLQNIDNKNENQKKQNDRSPAPAPEIKPAEKKPESSTPSTPATGATCPKCSKVARAGAKFCASCGTKFDRLCTGCGNTLKPTSKFCAKCGTKAE
jgi:hypothetical protein